MVTSWTRLTFATTLFGMGVPNCTELMVMAVPTCLCTAASICWALELRLTIAATNIKLAPRNVTTSINLSGLRSTFLILRLTSFIEKYSLSSDRLIGFSQDLGRLEMSDKPCRDKTREQGQPNAHSQDDQQRLNIQGGRGQVRSIDDI